MDQASVAERDPEVEAVEDNDEVGAVPEDEEDKRGGWVLGSVPRRAPLQSLISLCVNWRWRLL